VFRDIANKNLDWPEAIWEAWLSFEHAHGSLDELEDCMDKVEQAQTQVNIRRAKVVSFTTILRFLIESLSGSSEGCKPDGPSICSAIEHVDSSSCQPFRAE
jgi:hypothetical protein